MLRDLFADITWFSTYTVIGCIYGQWPYPGSWLYFRFNSPSTFTRSGAAAKFHSSRPVRTRFVLHAAAALVRRSITSCIPATSNAAVRFRSTQSCVFTFALEVYASTRGLQPTGHQPQPRRHMVRQRNQRHSSHYLTSLGSMAIRGARNNYHQ